LQRNSASDFGVPLKLAGLTEQIFVEGRQAYGGNAWSSQIVKLWKMRCIRIYAHRVCRPSFDRQRLR